MGRPDMAETLVEIHELIEEAAGDNLGRPELKALHEWADRILDAAIEDDDGADETIERIADMLDAMIALDVAIPIIGPLLERFDGVAISTALSWLHGVLKPDPARRARKKAERQERRQRRRSRRGR